MLNKFVTSMNDLTSLSIFFSYLGKMGILIIQERFPRFSLIKNSVPVSFNNNSNISCLLSISYTCQTLTRHFTYVSIFSYPYSSMRKVLLFPFYRCLERLLPINGNQDCQSWDLNFNSVYLEFQMFLL